MIEMDLSSQPDIDGRKRLYVDEMSRSLRVKRLIWGGVYFLFFRPTPRFCLEKWRLFLLRAFGAKIGHGSRVAPSCTVWAPWNLTMGNYACLADGVDCYSIAPISLGDYSTVSQRSFLCSASHDPYLLERPLFAKPISIASHAWVCAEAFIGPGITVAEGAVVGARAVVVKNVEPWTIVAGNPARLIKKRVIERRYNAQ
ncbi:putative colanic acid biosynthesis acetyltransferase [Ancylobacter sp. 6x-1]|uniref:Colanic acid biosynthesis acetyltransferase n=1 Tax=Ancylobacter crimeensis TaxID=2579147 RepID=A0ABT0D6N7_9HYPH|nr:putative colanic acid biosynthesis acetyltransferase [Ancylobacter crimeensis]MCK0195606.1 putative colanic acid biosynthesis acetyltransferase [Ancylobacter crimeensis]